MVDSYDVESLFLKGLVVHVDQRIDSPLMIPEGGDFSRWIEHRISATEVAATETEPSD